MLESISESKGVCKTARATPGLLITRNGWKRLEMAENGWK